MHRSEVTIGRSADEVWARIRDFGDLRWYPHVERCEVEGDDRTTWKVGSDLASVERIVEHDDASRSCSYVLVDFVGPAVLAREGGRSYDARNLIGHHRAALAVTPTGEKRCRVTYDVTVEGDDEMTRSIGRGYGEALTHLQSTLESQDHDA
jgi:carbon monoxide dehydrogenase subunit G